MHFGAEDLRVHAQVAGDAVVQVAAVGPPAALPHHENAHSHGFIVAARACHGNDGREMWTNG